MADQTAAQQALDEITTLEQSKKKILAGMPTTNTGKKSEELLAELEAKIKTIDTRVAELRQVAQVCVAPTDLVTPRSPESSGRTKVGNTAGRFIDAVLRARGDHYIPILDPGRKTIPMPLFVGISAELSFLAELIGQLQLRRSSNGLGLEGSANVTGKLMFGVGLALGFDIPYVGDFTIRAGIEAGPEIRAARNPIGISLTENANGLTGTFGAAVFDVAVSAQLYLDTPLPYSIIRYVPSFIPNASARDKTINYPMGRLSIFEVRTYAFSLTYSTRGFSYSHTSPNIGFTAEFKQKVKALYDGMISMFNDAVNKLNPANWDLNPFN
ncbi:MAG: hypothetical protein ACRBFS_15720 [Aureispira sp.]